MFRSLWFRLTGTVVLVVVVTMIVALVASLIIMQREFVDFVNTAVEALEVQPVEVDVPPSVRDIEIPDSASRPLPEPLPDFLNRRLPQIIREETWPSINVRVPQTVQDDAAQNPAPYPGWWRYPLSALHTALGGYFPGLLCRSLF